MCFRHVYKFQQIKNDPDLDDDTKQKMSAKFNFGLLTMTKKWKNRSGSEDDSEDDSEITKKFKEKKEKNMFLLGISAKFKSVCSEMRSKLEIKYTKVQFKHTVDNKKHIPLFFNLSFFLYISGIA